jgi:hypothetical protein
MDSGSETAVAAPFGSTVSGAASKGISREETGFARGSDGLGCTFMI